MNSRPMRREPSKSRRAGASTVEMAMVCPVLFLIVFGLIEVSLGYMAHHLIQDASRQGCRAAICRGQTNATVLTRINNLLAAERITGANTTILINNVPGDLATARVGDNVSVKITLDAAQVTFLPTTGYLKGTFSATCTMRHE